MALSAVPESLHAIDVDRQVAAIPQIHLSGTDDSVGPPPIAQHFVTAAASFLRSLQPKPLQCRGQPYCKLPQSLASGSGH